MSRKSRFADIREFVKEKIHMYEIQEKIAVEARDYSQAGLYVNLKNEWVALEKLIPAIKEKTDGKQ